MTIFRRQPDLCKTVTTPKFTDAYPFMHVVFYDAMSKRVRGSAEVMDMELVNDIYIHFRSQDSGRRTNKTADLGSQVRSLAA